MTHNVTLVDIPASLEIDAPYQRTRWRWLLALANTLMAINSTFVFLVYMKTGVPGWLMMNSCAPSIALWVAGFVAGSPLVMIAASVMMFGWGTLGLFVFSWSGTNLIAQIGHILMTLAVLDTLVEALRHRRWKALGAGLLLGLALHLPYRLAQTAWFNAQPGLMEKFFSGNP